MNELWICVVDADLNGIRTARVSAQCAEQQQVELKESEGR